jgi:eukaryotic-like serine/threonine-protein kinase
MTIAPGTRLGPFQVADLLGAGGMGAVYRAYDPRLQRHVAIKVLAPGFGGDADRLRRFEQEALAVARLAHPNILAVHDVGTHDGSPYLVTELLEGETLRKAMNGRPLPARKAIDYSTQIARGLAAAHEGGVVHRDIKPENLFLTREGRVKILDFGVAKLTGGDVQAAAGASSPTLTAHGLGPIGTAAYMSPEQARGDRTDFRADLFSLGIVLYEMLSGVSPFRRDTAAETLTAILREDPPAPVDSVAGPPALARVLQHCLEKNPADRFQTAQDLVFALDSISGTAPVSAAPRRRTFPDVARALGILSSVALIAGAAYVIGRRTAGDAPPSAISSVHRLTEFPGVEAFPAIAPDAKSIAFTARAGGAEQIFVRLVAGGTPLQITRDPVDHELPRWSPDSSSLVYFSPAAPGDIQGTLWQIPALGGAPRRVIDSVGGGDVGPGGRIAAFRLADKHTELITASADGSDARTIARFSEAVYFKYPRWSPDGRWIGYQRGDGVRWDIFAVEANGGTPRQLTHENGQIHGLSWQPDSAGIIYSSSRATTMAYLPTLGLWEQRLAGGEPRPLAVADLSYLHPDIHSDGAIVASRLQSRFDLWRYPIDGDAAANVQRAVRVTHQTGQVQTPTAGPGDREVAFLSDSGGHANLWIVDTGSGQLRQVTYERDPAVSMGVPVWSPDGKWISFVSSRGNTGLGFGVWLVKPDGGNLRNVAKRGLGVAWSPDARWIYYSEAGVAYKIPVDGGTAVRVRPGPARNVIGVAGGTMYFMVDRTLTDGSPGFEIHAATPEDGASRVLARIPPSRAPQWQIVQPAISPDGASLAMPLTDGVTTNIWTLSASTGEWRKITDFGERPTFIVRRVSWSSDGRSIVAAVGEADADIVFFEGKGGR